MTGPKVAVVRYLSIGTDAPAAPKNHCELEKIYVVFGIDAFDKVFYGSSSIVVSNVQLALFLR